MIAPATQRFMTERAGSHIHTIDVDHTPLAAAPDPVVAIIGEAVDAALCEPAPDPPRIRRPA